MTEQPKAFVIMPFDPEFSSIYEKLIKEPLEEAGYEVTRADSFLNQRNILGDIVRGITGASLIVADLTTNNPNVFYELGICHGRGLPTVLLAQSIEDVPFDLRSYKILIYETHFDKTEKLKRALKEIGTKHTAGQLIFDNPVTDFSRTPETVEHLEESSSDAVSNQIAQEDENELFDCLDEGEAAAERLTGVLEKLSHENEVIADRISKHASTMQSLSSNPVPGSAGKFRKIALLAAADMNNFSKKVEDILPVFDQTIDDLDENYSGFIRIMDPNSQDEEETNRFRATIEGLLAGSRTANESMDSYREAVIGLAARRLSKDLSRASRRQAAVLDGVIANIERVQAFCEKALALLSDKFNNAKL